MRIDRRLIGVLVISLIVGTLVSLYVIRERIETPINIIDDSHPSRALGGTSELDQDKYGLAFICREDLKQVAVNFAVLMEVNVTGGVGSVDPEGAGETIPEIANRMELLADAGLAPETEIIDVTIDGQVGSLVVYDFRSKLNMVLPAMGASQFPTVHAVFLDKSDRIVKQFEGVSDFFLFRGTSLDSMEITVNTNKSVYVASEDEAETQEDVEPIENAPAQGRIIFREMKRNDRISIVYRVASRSGEYPLILRKRLKGKNLIQLVTFEINGEVARDKILVHVMENGLYSEVSS